MDTQIWKKYSIKWKIFGSKLNGYVIENIEGGHDECLLHNIPINHKAIELRNLDSHLPWW